jgi:hypothetical protein
MTKHRAPLSIDAALARIAGHLDGGWAAMGAAVDRKESLVRAWGDPDRRELMPLDAAIALDVAFQACGGVGAPLFEAYARLLDLACVNRFADRATLGAHLSCVIREAAEAESAMLTAALPDAGPAETSRALREVDEALVALGTARSVLLDMRAGATPQQPP